MSIIIKQTDIDNFVELYTLGNTITSISQKTGFCTATISKNLKACGVTIDKFPCSTKEIISLPTNEIIAKYQSGESENSISKHYGVSRNAIRKRLRDNNISIRTQSESELLKWSQMTLEQRANQVKAAHDATLGVSPSFETRVKIAAAREKCVAHYHIGLGEPEFRQLLIKKGISHVYQKAVDIYNVDFAIRTIAVELTSFVGRYRKGNTKITKRAENLSKSGYKMLSVEFSETAHLLTFSDNIINFCNVLDRDNSPICCYWVIRCSSDAFTISKIYFD